MSSNKIEISVKDIPEIIKTLEEAEKEIEFERKSKNLFIDDLYKVCEISLKQDKEIERLNNIIKHTDSWIDRTIEIIKQQPSGNDEWILERLNGIKQCLKDSDKEC